MKRLFLLLFLCSAVAQSQNSFSGGTISGNVLPDATGRDLGSPDQRWDLYAQDFDVTGVFTGTPTLSGGTINGTVIGGTIPAAGSFTTLTTAGITDSGTSYFKVANAIRYADQFAGATVTAKIDAAIADCGSAQCLVVIPSNMAAGAPTSVPNTVTLLDLRRTTTLIGNSAGIEANYLVDAYNGTGTTNRVFGGAFQAHATAGGTGIVGEGETVGLFAAATRTGGTRPIWAANFLANDSVATATNGLFGVEVDMNASRGAAITNNAEDQMVGVKVVSGGTHTPLAGIQVQASTPASGAWLMGADIQNWKTFGVRVGAPVASGNPNLIMIPQADDSNYMVEGRNAADNATAWGVQNSGNIVTNGLIKGAFIQSPSANPANSGILRVASGDQGVMFRNNANSADVNGLSKDASDVVQVGGAAGIKTVGPVTINGGTTITKHLSATASLDFAAWSGGGDCQDLTITVTGAADGDTTDVGIPNALASVAGVVWSHPWVSAANTVTLRGCKPSAGASADPAAATVRADVWVH